jgi:DNA-binding PadR family transcriptional regulator
VGPVGVLAVVAWVAVCVVAGALECRGAECVLRWCAEEPQPTAKAATAATAPARAGRFEIGFFWSPAKSHVYKVLPRLERAGYAHRRPVRQSGRPDKQLWRITPRGRAALKAWLNVVDADPFEARGVFLLKLLFGDHGDPKRLVELVERFRDQAAARLQALRAIERRESRRAGDELPRMTLRQGLTLAEAHLRWAEEILPHLHVRATTTRAAAQR